MNDNWLALLAVIIGKDVTIGQVLRRLGLVTNEKNEKKILPNGDK